jgi:hypothetical protein
MEKAWRYRIAVKTESDTSVMVRLRPSGEVTIELKPKDEVIVAVEPPPIVAPKRGVDRNMVAYSRTPQLTAQYSGKNIHRCAAPVIASTGFRPT